MMIPMNKSVHFIITGGTIDSYYDPAQDRTVVSDRSYVMKYIASAVTPPFTLFRPKPWRCWTAAP